MRVLVTWGSKSGGTAEIGRVLAEELEKHGYDVTALAADKVGRVKDYDAAIIGGAIYANLWHGDAHRFVSRHAARLRKIPVWLFSSGPLDDSADADELPSPEQLSVLIERIGVVDHVTFGGRLAEDARGFPASAMAKKHAGDWRNLERVRTFAADLSRALPTATPGRAYEPAARSLWRLFAFGALGWVLCAGLMAGLMATVSPFWALTLHTMGAPMIFWGVSHFYFQKHGAREPLVTALAFAAIVLLLDAVIVAGLLLGSYEMFLNVGGTWLPVLLIFAVTYATGQVRLMAPSPEQKQRIGATA